MNGSSKRYSIEIEDASPLADDAGNMQNEDGVVAGSAGADAFDAAPISFDDEENASGNGETSDDGETNAAAVPVAEEAASTTETAQDGGAHPCDATENVVGDDEAPAPEEAAREEEAPLTVSAEEHEALKEELATSEKRRESLLADWERYKQRTADELAREKELACSALATDILPVLDDLERAIDHARQTGSTDIADGMMSIYKKAIGVYQKHGIKRIYPQGERFDATMHMAVQKTGADAAGVEPETVVQVLQCGYAMGDRILRPSMVVVAM